MDAAACRRQALDLLARREHSHAELERKLRARSYAEETVADVLATLEADGLISATRFAESFVRSRVAKGQGPMRVRKELTDRGVSEALFHEAVENLEVDWYALASAVRAKRFGTDRTQDFRERAKQARFLQYRGFDMEQIKSALDADVDYD